MIIHSAKAKIIKPKRCASCRNDFFPVRAMQKACGIECAQSLARKKREKVEKSADRLKREQLKTRSYWMKDAQKAFNAFIRERDKGKACISCGTAWIDGAVGGSFDCGHYRSVGSAPHLRFDESNAHGQCKKCNRWGSGRAVDYRLGLIAKAGIKLVETIESDQSERKYTIDELKAIKELYAAKLRGIRNGN